MGLRSHRSSPLRSHRPTVAIRLAILAAPFARRRSRVTNINFYEAVVVVVVVIVAEEEECQR